MPESNQIPSQDPLVLEGEKMLQEAEGILPDDSSKDNKKKRKKRDSGKPWFLRVWTVLLIIILIVLVAVSFLYFRYWVPLRNIMSESERVQGYFLAAQEQLLRADFRPASKSLELAGSGLEKMEKDINRLGVVAKIDRLEEQYDALKVIVLAGQNLSSGLKLATDITSQVLAPIERGDEKKIADISVEEKRKILQALFEATPDLHGARAQIDLALIQVNQIDQSGLHPSLLGYVKTMKTKLADASLALEKAEVISKILPSLLGYPQERNYLFLLENYNELRPTGGFIGTVGVLTAKNAEIESFESRNVYELDINAEGRLNIEPPEPISKYMNVDAWYLRDANWSPDFEVSAGTVMDFFNKESRLPGSPFAPQDFDGVVVITPKVVHDFLDLAGAIETGGFVFNKDNFTERLEYLVEIGYESVEANYSERKNIIGDLSSEIFSRFENLEMKEWFKLIDILHSNLAEKHIIVYLRDEFLQEQVNKQNWSGKIKDAPIDYLSFIDANLAALKTDEFMERRVVYQIYPDPENPGEYLARATMNYKNTGTFTWKSTRYRTYTRLYVPKGSTWIKTEGAMEDDRSSLPGKTDVYDELNKTVFGAFIATEPGKENKLIFEYRLPETVSKLIKDGHYQLLVQKQAGTRSHGLSLDLNFGAPVKGATPSEPKEQWGDSYYRLNTDLRIDRDFKVGL